MTITIRATGPQDADGRIPLIVTMNGKTYTGRTGGGRTNGKSFGSAPIVYSDQQQYGPLPGILSGGVSYTASVKEETLKIGIPGTRISGNTGKRGGIFFHSKVGNVGCVELDDYSGFRDDYEDYVAQGGSRRVAVIPYGRGQYIPHEYNRDNDEPIMASSRGSRRSGSRGMDNWPGTDDGYEPPIRQARSDEEVERGGRQRRQRGQEGNMDRAVRQAKAEMRGGMDGWQDFNDDNRQETRLSRRQVVERDDDDERPQQRRRQRDRDDERPNRRQRYEVSDADEVRSPKATRSRSISASIHDRDSVFNRG